MEQSSEKNNQTKCEVIMGNHKLEYHFENKDNHTMYPLSFKSSRTTGSFKLEKKLEFHKFEAEFGEAVHHVTAPKGGCEKARNVKFTQNGRLILTACKKKKKWGKKWG